MTERERFEVPVHAIGPRAILDFRDEFNLPTCPVKGTTEKTQLVRNIGNNKAKFTLQTQRCETVHDKLMFFLSQRNISFLGITALFSKQIHTWNNMPVKHCCFSFSFNCFLGATVLYVESLPLDSSAWPTYSSVVPCST